MGNDTVVGVSDPTREVDPRPATADHMTPAGEIEGAIAPTGPTGPAVSVQGQDAQEPGSTIGSAGGIQTLAVEPATTASADTDLTDLAIDSQIPAGRSPQALASNESTSSLLSEHGWPWLKPIILAVVGGGLFATLVFSLIRPQDGTSDSIGENAALAWNTTIKRLDIQPLYPPQEDLYVGDVYLTVSPVPELVEKLREYPTNVFDGKAVKVGKIPIELSSLMTERFKYEKQETGSLSKDETAQKTSPTMLTLRKPPLGAVDAVPLSLVSFPGITINQTVRADTNWQSLWFGRSTTATEIVSIPAAETYSMSTTEAVLALRAFCIERLTALYCRDEDARRILQYALGERVNAVVNGEYVFQISILVATQVYVTDQFDIRRLNSDELRASLGNQDSPTPDQGTTQVEEPDQGAGIARPAPQPAENAVTGSYHDEQKSKQELTRTFDRPVAFGFKSVAFALQPTKFVDRQAQ